MSNESAVADGYEITDVTLSQDSVTLTGSTSDIESVSQVYTVVNIPDNLSEDYTTTATVITENADGDILNINTDPSEVDVTVQVSPEGVSVPIVANITNEREGYTYEATILDSQNATLSGDYDTINNTESVSATVDVSGITTRTTVDAPIVLPDGVTGSDPSSVRVQVVPTASESSSSSSSSASSNASSESDEDSASSDTASSESSAESATSSESGTSGNESTIEEDTTSGSDTSDSSSTSEVGVTTGVSNNLQNGNGNVQADQINSTSSESVSSSSSANVFNGILAFLASFF